MGDGSDLAARLLPARARGLRHRPVGRQVPGAAVVLRRARDGDHRGQLLHGACLQDPRAADAPAVRNLLWHRAGGHGAAAHAGLPGGRASRVRLRQRLCHRGHLVLSRLRSGTYSRGADRAQPGLRAAEPGHGSGERALRAGAAAAPLRVPDEEVLLREERAAGGRTQGTLQLHPHAGAQTQEKGLVHHHRSRVSRGRERALRDSALSLGGGLVGTRVHLTTDHLCSKRSALVCSINQCVRSETCLLSFRYIHLLESRSNVLCIYE